MTMAGDIDLFVCLNACITSNVTFSLSLTVTLGQTVGQQQAGSQFKGELSKVNIHRSVNLDCSVFANETYANCLFIYS